MGTFIVTGASSGIGRAVAAALAARSVTVLAVARSEGPLRELATSSDGKVVPVVADLATEAGVQTLVEAGTAFDRIDGVVHSAGSLVSVEPYGELTSAALTRHFAIHVGTPIEVNNRLGERLRGGRVIYIDSYSASSPRDGWAGYSILKAAAQMAARAASQELDEIEIVRIFPGGVRTPLVEAVLAAPETSAAANAFRGFDAAGDLAEPQDIGTYIARIAVDVTSGELAAREFWDYGDAATHG